MVWHMVCCSPFFAGVWIAVSVFGLIMVGNIDWQQMLIDAVREVIPGVAD